jgi:hypothetical protein
MTGQEIFGWVGTGYLAWGFVVLPVLVITGRTCAWIYDRVLWAREVLGKL